MRMPWMLGLALAVVSTPAQAQQLRTAHLRSDAGKVPGHVDRNLFVQVRQDLLNSVGGENAVQIRMIRGSKARIRSFPRTRENCLVLQSYVLYPVHRGGGTLDLGFAFSDEWIRANKGRVYPETYTLVFEFRNAIGNTLKLDAHYLEAYLANSVEVVLDPPNNLSPARITYIERWNQPQPRTLAPAGQCWKATARFRGREMLASAFDCSVRDRRRPVSSWNTTQRAAANAPELPPPLDGCRFPSASLNPIALGSANASLAQQEFCVPTS
jgi:hypothetical protein